MVNIFGSGTSKKSASIYGGNITTHSSYDIITNSTNKTSFYSNKSIDSLNLGELVKSIYNNIYNEVEELYNLFLDNNLETYNVENFILLSLKLFKHRTKTDIYFNSIIDMLINNITMVQKTKNIQIKLNEAENKIITLEEKASILDNMEKLKEYINQLKSDSILIETEATLNKSATIKQEYIIYINKYGMPQDAIFDMKKLAEIKNSILLNDIKL